MFAAERTKEGALRAAGADLEAIRAVAQRTVRARGYSYPCSGSAGEYVFSTRNMTASRAPPGADAVRVEIGAMPGKTGSACCFRPCAFPRQHPTAGRTCRLIRCGAAGCVQFL